MDTTTATAAAHGHAIPGTVSLTATELPAEPAPNFEPALGEVLREQFAAVGLALRNEARVVAVIMALITAFWVLGDGPGTFWIDPEIGIPAALLALLVPMAVWKGEGPGQRGYHHAMPVDPGLHAAIRGSAGLAWSLAAMAAYFVWMVLVSVVTGGRVEAIEPWQWAAPFAGATVLYLLGSALTLVSSHPWRWLGGSFVGFLFLDGFRDVDALRPLVALVNTVLKGRYGISTLLTGMAPESIGFVSHYHGSRDADMGAWLASVGIWLALGVGAFAVAAYRQPES